MKNSFTNFIREHITEHNRRLDIINHLTNSIKLDNPTYVNYLETKTSTRFFDIVDTHYKNYRASLDLIKNCDTHILDSQRYQLLFKDNLNWLVSTNPNTSIETKTKYFLKLINPTNESFDFPQDYHIYEQNKPVYDTYDNIHLEPKMAIAKRLYDLPHSPFMQVISKLPRNDNDLISLRQFILSYHNTLVSNALAQGRKSQTNIEELPEFPEVVEKFSTIFNKLSYEELNIINSTFMNTSNTLLEQALLHPCLLSVLGNTLFFKVIIPLASNYYPRMITNNDSNWQKLIYKAIQRAKEKRMYAGFVSFSNTTMSLLMDPRTQPVLAYGGVAGSSLGVAAYIYQIFFNTHPPAPAPEEKSLGARKAIESMEDPEGFEGHLGEKVEAVRDFAARGSVELGRTIGRVHRSTVKGYLAETRESAEMAGSWLDTIYDSFQSGSDKTGKK